MKDIGGRLKEPELLSPHPCEIIAFQTMQSFRKNDSFYFVLAIST